MNKRTIVHRDYTIEYERTPDRTGITIWYYKATYSDAYDESLSYGTDKEMTLHDICRELLEEIRKYQRADPDADIYYRNYSNHTLYCFIDVLKEMINEEE